jgi:hemolysin activation/secretion protein
MDKLLLFFIAFASPFLVFIKDALADGFKYPVTQVIFEYGNPTPALPDLKLLENAYFAPEKDGDEIQLGEFMSGFSRPVTLGDDGIFRLGEIGVHFLKEYGFEGIVALPHPDYIDPISGEDLRPERSGKLVVQLWVSILNSIDFESNELRENERKRLEESIRKYFIDSKCENKAVRAELFKDIKRIVSHSSRANQVVLSASKEAGRVNAVVKSERKKSDNFIFSVANAGSPSTGRWLMSTGAQTNQLSGNDDTLSFGYTVSNTAERHSFTGRYYLPFLPLEAMGVAIGIGYSSYDASTFAKASVIDFDGEALFGDLGFSLKSAPFAGESLIAGMELGLKLENVKAFNSISNQSADVAMLTPRISISLEHKNNFRIAQSSVSLLGNMLSLDNADLLSLGGINVTDRYARLLLSHSEYLQLGRMFGSSGKYLSRHTLSMNLQASLSMSNDRHLPQHQFITGGTGSVRGYPESPAAGDSGFLASLEYRLPFLIFPSSGNKAPLVWTMAPFVDWAKTSVNQALFYESDHVLVGSGISFYLALPYGLFASVEFAKPLREVKVAGVPLEGTKSSDYRVHGNVGWKF